jgi:hypothetical protein
MYPLSSTPYYSKSIPAPDHKETLNAALCNPHEPNLKENRPHTESIRSWHCTSNKLFNKEKPKSPNDLA